MRHDLDNAPADQERVFLALIVEHANRAGGQRGR
jgi:hypothetical protein